MKIERLKSVEYVDILAWQVGMERLESLELVNIFLIGGGTVTAEIHGIGGYPSMRAWNRTA